MSDENTTTTATAALMQRDDEPETTVTAEVKAPEPTIKPDPESEPRFTQAEVNRLLAAERRKTKEKAKSKPEPEPTTSLAPDHQELLKRIAELEATNAFATATANLSLEQPQRSALQTLFKAEQPEDPVGWAKQRVKDLGWTRPAQPQDPYPNTTATPSEIRSDGGAPATPKGYSPSDDPNLWDSATIAQIRRDKGGAKQGDRWIRQQWDQWLSGVTIEPPNKRR